MHVKSQSARIHSQLFQTFDLDKNNFIDRAELAVGLRRMGLPLLPYALLPAGLAWAWLRSALYVPARAHAYGPADAPRVVRALSSA